MKKLVLFALILTMQFIIGQSRNPRNDQQNYVQGQLIVKLKDEVNTKIKYGARGSAKGAVSTNIDIAKLIGLGDKVEKTTVMFDQSDVNKSVKARRKTINGTNDPRFPVNSSLKNIFTLELKDKNENIYKLIEQVKKNEKVEYVEPNYIFSINDYKISSDIIYSPQGTTNTATTTTPNDPLYSQQQNIKDIKLDKVWEQYGTDASGQIIAILDTGVDYKHPDLKDNIWVNEAELNGVAGYDDDGNGFVDDVYGWDFVNNNNEPLDDNMHGTHVAGIASAVGNNGVGITGAAWNAKIMPIKIFQANGTADVQTIAKGIAYATKMGATIINMSFGSYAESLTLRNALENAYHSSFLVAAAGNDKIKIGPCKECFPSYPAAYSYVLGVEDYYKIEKGIVIGYTNYDQDGSVFSKYPNLLNYETTAPGTTIMSTVPNGGYRALTGTSMASPLVAGFLATYQKVKPESKELMFGKIIDSKEKYINALTTLSAVAKPKLKVLTVEVDDKVTGNKYQDGQLDAGEEILLYPTIKNYLGKADSVRVQLKFGGTESAQKHYRSRITLLDTIVKLGSVSAYGVYKEKKYPLKFKVAKNTAHNNAIEFRMLVWDKNNENLKDSLDFNLNVRNKIKLGGIITKDTTLYAGTEYLITDALILKGIKMTIKPGVNISFGADSRTGRSGNIQLYENASIVGIGKKDSLITIKKDVSWNLENNPSMQGNFEYTVFDGMSFHSNITNGLFINGCDVGSAGIVKKSTIIEPKTFATFDFEFNNVVEYKEKIVLPNNNLDYSVNPLKSNVISNIRAFTIPDSQGQKGYKLSGYNAPGGTFIEFKGVYMGTSSIEKMKELNIDGTNGGNGVFTYNNARTTPYSEAHGIVWKVLVNGKNAFDEYETMDPIGVGTHTFEVHFNKPVNTNFPPTISYGVREPFTQNQITEQGTWNATGSVYTVEHTVKIGAADGVNRIHVIGAKDLDNFPVPVERRRFNMLIQSAGSASTGFFATAGLGKIDLEWQAPSNTALEDVLGYNIYRYETITDSTFTKKEKLNKNLVTDIKFTDFDVVESKKYFYSYKILRTSLKETDFSKEVSAYPLTSKLGDSNGDNTINVQDLVQKVDYILGNNPQPFIFKAADVNNDKTINVLDIVGAVDIILNPRAGRIATKRGVNYYSNQPIGEAELYWKGNDLYIKSDKAIAGIQLAFKDDFKFTYDKNLHRFENLSYSQDNQKVLMLYSFNNRAIPAGTTKILTKATENPIELAIEKAAIATVSGRKLKALFKDAPVSEVKSTEQTNYPEIVQIYPNPADTEITLKYYLPETMDKVEVTIYDMKAQKVWQSNSFKNTQGNTLKIINVSELKSGMYIMAIDIFRDGEIAKREVKHIIKK